MWQHVQLSEQIRPWDTLACCWDVKQPTDKQTAPGSSVVRSDWSSEWEKYDDEDDALSLDGQADDLLKEM